MGQSAVMLGGVYWGGRTVCRKTMLTERRVERPSAATAVWLDWARASPINAAETKAAARAPVNLAGGEKTRTHLVMGFLHC